MYSVVIRQYGKERVVRVVAETISDAIEKVSRVFYVDIEKTRRMNDGQTE